jgi:hypothetical protein
MNKVLQGLKGTVCYPDDILITGGTDNKHLENLVRVLKLLRQQGLRMKKDKCLFFRRVLNTLARLLIPQEQNIRRENQSHSVDASTYKSIRIAIIYGND